MKQIVFTTTLYFCFFTLLSCRNANGENQQTQSDSLSYTYKTSVFNQKTRATGDSSNAFKAKIIHPIFDFKNHASLKDSVDKYLSYIVYRGYPTAEEANQAFVEYAINEVKNGNGYAGIDWESYDSIAVVFNTSKSLSLLIDHYSFTGGAHGNPSVTYLNFDPKTGKHLNYHDIIIEGRNEELRRINLKHFKVEKKISSDETLEESGYFIVGDDLPLPSSFAFTAKGLLMSYNYYEIAAYVDGVISYTIPYSDLKDVLTERYLH